MFAFVFFFKHKTAYELLISDWSSDVCSSDLDTLEQPAPSCHGGAVTGVAPTFEEIVSEYGALISRIAMSYESDITQREDLVQQIFLAIWQALPTFRGDSSVTTFVGKIAQHR